MKHAFNGEVRNHGGRSNANYQYVAAERDSSNKHYSLTTQINAMNCICRLCDCEQEGDWGIGTYWHALTIANDSLYVVGGCRSVEPQTTEAICSTVWTFSFEQPEWRSVDFIPGVCNDMHMHACMLDLSHSLLRTTSLRWIAIH
jgi:hypothetical protein